MSLQGWNGFTVVFAGQLLTVRRTPWAPKPVGGRLVLRARELQEQAEIWRVASRRQLRTWPVLETFPVDQQ